MNNFGSGERCCGVVSWLRSTMIAMASVASVGILPAHSQETISEGFSPFVQSELAYVSNLFRLPGADQAEMSFGDRTLADQILRLGVGFDFNKSLSRQGLSAQAEVFRNDYDHYSFLNHTSGKVSGNWQWVAGLRWDGQVQLDYERKIQGFTESRSSQLDERDIYGVRAIAGYSLNHSWRLRVALAQKDQEHGLEERQQLDRTLRQLVTELRFTSPKRSYVGFRTAWSSADFPNPELRANVLVDNSYQELESGFTVDWRPSLVSAIKGRIGATKREYDSFSDRDFSGITWRGDYTWKPRKRYRLQASLWRDLDAYSDAVTSYVVEAGIGVEAQWQVTPKTTIAFDIVSRARDYDGDPSIVDIAGPRRSDDVLSYGLEGELSITPKVQATLGYEYEERESNVNQWDFDCYTVVLGFKASL